MLVRLNAIRFFLRFLDYPNKFVELFQAFNLIFYLQIQTRREYDISFDTRYAV